MEYGVLLLTIKDIARLADVSISTVSKVLNNKDENISEETRKRVLDVVREYQFVPYKNVIEKLEVPSRTIAVVIPDITNLFFAEMVKCLEHSINNAGYSMLLCNTAWQGETEEKQLQILLQKNIDGLFIYPIDEKGLTVLAENKIPFVSLKYLENIRGNIACFDFAQAGYYATKILIDNMHEKIGFISNRPEENNPFIAGYKKAMFELGVPLDEKYIVNYRHSESGLRRLSRLFDMGVTAILCEDTESVPLTYQFSLKRKIVIPEDLSVVSLDGSVKPEMLMPPVTSVKYPFDSLSQKAMELLISLIYRTSEPVQQCLFTPSIEELGSVSVPYGSKGKKIVIVGDLSVDHTLIVPRIPLLGGVEVAEKRNSLVGGKAANQSICVSQFGGNVSVIARLGDDKEGKTIYEALCENRINTSGVYFDKQNSTGCAYLSTTHSGESSVVVYPGANNALSVEQIHANSGLLDGAEFCSSHTAIPTDTLMAVREICIQKKVKMVLKACSMIPVGYMDTLLKGLYMIIPNEKEIDMICPGPGTLEEKMHYCKEKGVENVLVTLSEKGCAFLDDDDTVQYYPTKKVQVVDTAGASDCFISSLLVCLAGGRTMEQSIGYANHAAALSVTRQGNYFSATYKSMLSNFFGSINE